MNNKRNLGVSVLWVISILLIAAFALSQTPPANPVGGTVAPEIEGTWLVTVTIKDGPPPFPALVTYARGGALTVTDGLSSPAVGYIHQGTWTKTGTRKFAFTFMGLQYDAKGVFSGYFRVHETLQLDGSGKTYDGMSTSENLDPAQKVTGSGILTTHATRVTAQ